MAINGRESDRTTPGPGTSTAEDADRKASLGYVREAAERGLDLQIGAVLSMRERVEGAVEPWTSSSGRERELRGLRTEVVRELSKLERRGGQARRKALRQARLTRNRVERELRQRRRRVGRTLRQGRTRFEGTLRRAQAVARERVPV